MLRPPIFGSFEIFFIIFRISQSVPLAITNWLIGFHLVALQKGNIYQMLLFGNATTILSRLGIGAFEMRQGESVLVCQNFFKQYYFVNFYVNFVNCSL